MSEPGHFSRKKGQFLFIVLSLIWGGNFALMKKATLAFGPISIAAWRVVGAAALLGFVIAMTKTRWPFTRKDFPALLTLTIVGYSWPFYVLPYVIGHHGGAFAGMMIGLVPLMTILVSIPMLGIRPTRREVLGVLGGLICLGVILGEGTMRSIPIQHALLGATVPLCYATGNTFVKRRFAGVSSLALTCACFTLTGFTLMPLALGFETVRMEGNENFALAVTCLVLVAFLVTGFCGYMFYRLIQQYGPLYAGMVAYVIPVCALLWGWLDGEQVTMPQVLALVGILAMVGFVQTAESPKPPGPEVT